MASPNAAPFPERVMRTTARWAVWFATDWRAEAPTQIHSRDIAQDGSPEWHPDFMRWLTEDRVRPQRKDPNQRLRTTKVMRRLRRSSAREYEVCYRILILGERLADTTKWLNERAQRNSIPYPRHRPHGPHYIEKDTLALIIAGIDYARGYW